MKTQLILFTSEQGNLLIRLLIAHFVSDFILQSNKIVETKKIVSVPMLLHVIIIFLISFLVSGLFITSSIIALTHWLIDSGKIQLKNKNIFSNKILFLTDQVLHIIAILAIWTCHFNLLEKVQNAVLFPFLNYQWSLVLLAYIWITFPVGYIIKFAIESIKPTNSEYPINNIEQGGKLIGQFERIIILSLVLLGQYEAIGFLITGKSIIRFADADSKGHLRSEYVLVGTMMSYAIAILTGVFVNYLLSI